MTNFLKDLTMAGVKWELSDNSIGFMESLGELSAISGDNSGRTRVASSVVPPTAPVTPISVETVAAMATRPTNTAALIRMIAEFNHPLRAAVTNVVVPHIAKNPRGIMVITDIPSSDDDASGQILSGAAGELFDKMIGAIGLNRDSVYITPLLFWRTPGGRTPTENELALARPFVNQLIELTEPKIILTLGTLAAAQMVGADLMRDCGGEFTMSGGIKVFPIYHPNYLILKPDGKQIVWATLQNVQKLLKSA